MQHLIPFDAEFLPSTRHSSSYRGVERGVVASLSARQKKPAVFLLAGSLWGLPCGSTVAAESATSAGQDLSPASVAARIPDAPAVPTDIAVPEPWNLHGQFTFVKQYQPSFRSSYQRTNSSSPVSNGEATMDLTLFAGVRLWTGGAFYINPEIDQGLGLSNTLRAAGFPRGEAYKVGKSKPYFRLQRAFFRQRFDFGGDTHPISPGANELGGTQTAVNVPVTVGKFSVVDIVDTNAYAHDPGGDVLNGSVIDAAAFDTRES
jgi:high affinity Mn2+ porin